MDAVSTISPYHDEIKQLTFSGFDWILLTIMLGANALIGIYYGFCNSKQNTTEEYLLGGKAMNVFPVAMSLISSQISGTVLLSVPAEIYKFGAVYWWTCIAILVNSLVSTYVFMPVFMKLQLTSTYEYLKVRFDNKIRIFASFLAVLWILLYNPIVVYIPAVAFAQATGINLHLITLVICVVCIFYTTIGGLKSVVWADTLQTIAIAGSMIAVFCLGISSAGGLVNVWEKSLEGHRLDIFDFNIDPTRRDSFWIQVIGSSAFWMYNFGVNQSTVQRLLAVPSLTDARKTVLIFSIGTVVIKTLSTITGLIIYAKYSDCDLLLTKQISKNDQLLPYYVMDVAGHIPGLPGLFIAGIISAGLSTLSTTLNTLSAIIYADFISPFLSDDTTQEQTNNILKLIVVITGTLCMLLVYAVEKMDDALPLTVSVVGITGGPLLGLFFLGMLFRQANAQGAFWGGISSLLLSSCMVFGNKYYQRMGMFEDVSKPISTEGCDFYVNVTLPNNTSSPEKPFVLFRISFWYQIFVGAVVVVVTGLIVSWCTNKDDPTVHPDLISPVVRYWMNNERRSDPPDYCDTHEAVELVAHDTKSVGSAVK